MKSKKQIEEAIKYLEENRHPSANMGYERAGALQALRWVLKDTKGLPVWIGSR